MLLYLIPTGETGPNGKDLSPAGCSQFKSLVAASIRLGFCCESIRLANTSSRAVADTAQLLLDEFIASDQRASLVKTPALDSLETDAYSLASVYVCDNSIDQCAKVAVVGDLEFLSKFALAVLQFDYNPIVGQQDVKFERDNFIELSIIRSRVQLSCPPPVASAASSSARPSSANTAVAAAVDARSPPFALCVRHTRTFTRAAVVTIRAIVLFPNELTLTSKKSAENGEKPEETSTSGATSATSVTLDESAARPKSASSPPEVQEIEKKAESGADQQSVSLHEVHMPSKYALMSMVARAKQDNFIAEFNGSCTFLFSNTGEGRVTADSLLRSSDLVFHAEYVDMEHRDECVKRIHATPAGHQIVIIGARKPTEALAATLLGAAALQTDGAPDGSPSEEKDSWVFRRQAAAAAASSGSGTSMATAKSLRAMATLFEQAGFVCIRYCAPSLPPTDTQFAHRTRIVRVNKPRTTPVDAEIANQVLRASLSSDHEQRTKEVAASEQSRALQIGLRSLLKSKPSAQATGASG